jgi:hypothetical protein
MAKAKKFELESPASTLRVARPFAFFAKQWDSSARNPQPGCDGCHSFLFPIHPTIDPNIYSVFDN